jgi:hypothetical protein
VNLRAAWSFVAGDSKFAPAGVAVAALVALLLEHGVPRAGPWVGAAFVAVVAAGLVAGVFERTG